VWCALLCRRCCGVRTQGGVLDALGLQVFDSVGYVASGSHFMWWWWGVACSHDLRQTKLVGLCVHWYKGAGLAGDTWLGDRVTTQ
jgi:hypothetical protein